MTSIRDALMTPILNPGEIKVNKVTVVGSGAVGMACAFTILIKDIARELVLIDMNENLVHGEVLDMQQCGPYINNPVIKWSTGYDDSKNSNICVVTAGARQREGESRVQLVQRNVEIFKTMIPQLAKNSPDSILLIVSNPCDILSLVAQKLSGFPPHRVIGSGTALDSARFRYFISERLGVAPSSLHGWIIGEHGDTSVPVWSGVNIAGVRLIDVKPNIGTENDPENWQDIHKQVVEGAGEIIRLKGYTSWAIGVSVSKICSAIMNDTKECLPVSTYLKGCGDQTGGKDVYISLPCLLGRAGVLAVVKQALTENEKNMLQRSIDFMLKVINDIKF